MKYKRISTKDYLVNENQFIELLENKALEGWYLKNISLNFLTFEKRTPQRKHYKIYYKQINKDIKEAGCRIIVNYFGLQVVEVEDLFAQPLKQDVGDKKEILSTIYNFTTHYFLMIMAIVLLIAYQPFKIHGLPSLPYLTFYFGTYLFYTAVSLISLSLFFFGLCNLSHLKKVMKNKPFYLENIFKNKIAYKKIIQQYPLITQKDSDLCFKYKQKYVVLKGQEVFYINNKEGLPLSKYIKYYQRLKV